MSTMPTSKLYLIAGPAEDLERANAFAARLDPVGGELTFGKAFLYVVGTDDHLPTHTGCFGPIAITHARLVEAVIARQFPGWVCLEAEDASAALAQAGLARVEVVLPQIPTL